MAFKIKASGSVMEVYSSGRRFVRKSLTTAAQASSKANDSMTVLASVSACRRLADQRSIDRLKAKLPTASASVSPRMMATLRWRMRTGATRAGPGNASDGAVNKIRAGGP